MNGELAYEVDAAKVLKVQVATSCHPRKVVFVERAYAEDFRRMPQDLAEAYFASSAERLPEQLPAVIQSRRQLLTELSSLPCYLFRYSGTPQSGAAELIKSLKLAGERS